VPLPSPRGELTERLLDAFGLPPHALAAGVPAALDEEDLQLALYLCYELHYRGLPGVDERWEWEPALLEIRRELEGRFEGRLFERLGPPSDGVAAEEMDIALRAIADSDDAPPLARFVESRATLEQVLEFVVHRSAYQLKEADPHSFAIARLHGPPKAALVEIQADEYGSGRPDGVHAELFAVAMEELGLDRTYGAYLDRIPGVTLATVNLMSMLALQRRWRGAIVGHLALFEMTSSLPNRRYAAGLRRLGFGDRATAFFDEHVVADAVHENIAAVDLAGGLARLEPEMSPQILWGARALVLLESDWARHLMGCFEDGRSSLRAPAGLPA